jgi:hypothetical protein
MYKRILLAMWLAAASFAPAFATTILPLDLGQIVDQSANAFEGTVTDNRTGRDPQTGMLVTLTTFQVHDVLKGQPGATFTIKQIGGSSKDEGLHYRVQGVPRFEVGESYIVFLPGISSAGFSSPVGLSQGRFSIADGPQGREVSNGRDFREMTENVAGMVLPEQARAKAKADLPVRKLGLDEFKDMVRGHLRSPR